jgi:hypothetical protein
MRVCVRITFSCIPWHIIIVLVATAAKNGFGAGHESPICSCVVVQSLSGEDLEDTYFFQLGGGLDENLEETHGFVA